MAKEAGFIVKEVVLFWRADMLVVKEVVSLHFWRETFWRENPLEENFSVFFDYFLFEWTNSFLLFFAGFALKRYLFYEDYFLFKGRFYLGEF